MTATSIFHVGQRLTDFDNVDLTVERVASGGFGEVAMGPDQMQGGRWRALKALRPDLLARLGAHGADLAAAEARLRASFLREALTWKGLWPHPTLLVAEFVTQINGEPMLVLNYAEQGSLRDYFASLKRQGAWVRLDGAIDFAQEIAAGLVALHTPAPDLLRDHPIVHRDLKPENILLQHGWPKITDFGLAKAVSEAAAPAPGGGNVGSAGPLPASSDILIVATATQAYPTQRGAMLGTPAYMAPEQWLDASQAGPPADAYAFGLILAELFTGRHPLLPLDQPHTLADWQAAHLMGQPIPLRQLGREVSTALLAGRETDKGRQQAALEQVEGLVARLLAKQATARPTLDAALATLQAAAVTLGEQPYTPDATYYPPTVEHQVRFWQEWAGVCHVFGLYAEALARIERALALTPNDVMTLVSYGGILSGLGREEEALAVERRTLGLLSEGERRQRAAIWNNVANRLLKLHRYAEAEAAYAEAVHLAPTNAEAWHNRACNAGAWALEEQAAGRRVAARAQVENGLHHIVEALALNLKDPSYIQTAAMLRQLRDQL